MKLNLGSVLLFAMFAVGCGVEEEPSPFECTTAIGPIRVDFEADCGRVAKNVETAKQVLILSGLVEDEIEFDNLYKGIPIVVRDTFWLRSKGEGLYVTGTHGSDGIVLEKTMDALVHEMLHHLEWSRWNFLGGTMHSSWDRNGFDAASSVYEKRRHIDLRK